MKRMAALMVAGAVAMAVVGVPAQMRNGAAQPVSDAIRASWDGAKKKMKDSAEDVSQAIYDFRPVDTVRTFGEVVAHTAGANYVFCSAVRGEPSPMAEDAFESLPNKAAIVKAFNESLAYCDAAYMALTDQTAANMIDMPFGGGKGARAAALIGNVGHVNEHYGNLVTYMRIKGIVPPSSRR